jgi:hypothetical protein
VLAGRLALERELDLESSSASGRITIRSATTVNGFESTILAAAFGRGKRCAACLGRRTGS